jgi:hypothetical protein
VWARTHLVPWVLRRLRHQSSGDHITAKRPEPLPVIVEAPDAAPARRGFKLHRDEVRALEVALAPSKAKLEANVLHIVTGPHHLNFLLCPRIMNTFDDIVVSLLIEEERIQRCLQYRISVGNKPTY